MVKGRGRGDLRSQFGSFLRTAVEQLGTVGEAVAKTGRAGRSRLDEALLERRRSRALAEIGEAVQRLVREGELRVPAELHELLDRVESIEEQIRRERKAAPRADRQTGRREIVYEDDELADSPDDIDPGEDEDGERRSPARRRRGATARAGTRGAATSAHRGRHEEAHDDDAEGAGAEVGENEEPGDDDDATH